MRWLRVMGLALVGLGLTTVGCGSDDSGGAEGGNNSSSNGAATCDGATTGGGTGATGGETTGGTTGGETTFDPAMCSEIVRPRANPVEYVGLTVSELATAEEVMAFLGAIYGDAARAGQAHQDTAIQEGLTLTVSEDPASAEQVILELNMEVARAGVETPRRTILRVPASTAYGAVFMDTVEVALTRAQEVYARDPADSEPFWLEHRLRSVHGGNLDVRVRYEGGLTWLELQTHTPETSLLPGRVNQPAFTGEPFESLAGEVNFHLSIDQFQFFSSRAYGITAGANQNFRDFELQPHNWLRLTVEPDLDNELINVGFEVVTLDGRRLDLARAPASLLAGDQFRENVIRMHANMTRQVEAGGAASRFEVPFYYDDPSGGGVVQVIARGDDGDFAIAYGVESPVNFLRDTDFIDYQGKVEVPDVVEGEVTCEELGSEAALEGRFEVTFVAAEGVVNAPNLKAPLRGNIWGSVFRAEDVSGLGPREGAQSVASFAFEGVDLTDPDNLSRYTVEADLPVGAYQLLGFIDIDANADPDNPDPDKGDPVTVPIGDYPLNCAVQPITVEFALLRP